MESEFSLLHSKVPATCPNPEPLAILTNDLLNTLRRFVYVFFPRDVKMCRTFPIFTSRLTPLLAITEASTLLIVLMF